MTVLRLVDTDPAQLAVDAMVVGVYRRPDAAGPVLAPGTGGLAAAFAERPGGGLETALRRLGAAGTAGATDEVTKLATFGIVPAPLVAAVGLGDVPAAGTPPLETLRRAAGAAVRSLAGCAEVTLALPVTGPDATGPERTSAGAGAAAPARAVRALAEGALLGAYQFAGYRTLPDPERRDPVGTVAIVVPDATDPALLAEVERAGTVAAAVVRTRDWVNTAPNELRPPGFADAVVEAARDAGLEVEVLDEKALRQRGFGGILAVGQGSAAPPRLVRIAYRPDRANARVALVGKGVTFDTGGISLKRAQGMWEMKSDMAGAAAVAATMLAVAALRPPVAVTGYLPMVENMPSGSAYRPGDVIRMYNGKRVEVFNTDAEGRLILADAMAWACEESPDYLLETSTLTGGQTVALGTRVAGVMGTAELCELLRRTGDRVGEPAWPMPLPDDVRTGMESDVADISQTNTTMDRAGHMLQGGIFLSEFVTDQVAWAHIDVAGPAYHTGDPAGYWAKGGTGVPVRTFIELIEDLGAGG